MKRVAIVFSLLLLIPLGYIARVVVYPNVVLQRYLQLLADHPGHAYTGHAYTTTVTTKGSYPVEFYVEEPAKSSAGAPVRLVVDYANPNNSIKGVVKRMSNINSISTDLTFDGKTEGYDYDRACVRLSDSTRVFLNGTRVERDAIRTGDVVEAFYYGQHDSLPPILLASAIYISRHVSP